jgi:hypothetical protein
MNRLSNISEGVLKLVFDMSEVAIGFADILIIIIIIHQFLTPLPINCMLPMCGMTCYVY